MFKKVLIITSLISFGASNAILLRDGSNVPKKKVDRVISILIFLKNSSKKEHRRILGGLFRARHSGCINLNTFPYLNLIDKEQVDKKLAEVVKYCHQIGLCNEAGYMDMETQAIIKSSLRGYLERSVKFASESDALNLAYIKNPISWKWWTQKQGWSERMSDLANDTANKIIWLNR